MGLIYFSLLKLKSLEEAVSKVVDPTLKEEFSKSYKKFLAQCQTKNRISPDDVLDYITDAHYRTNDKKINDC